MVPLEFPNNLSFGLGPRFLVNSLNLFFRPTECPDPGPNLSATFNLPVKNFRFCSFSTAVKCLSLENNGTGTW